MIDNEAEYRKKQKKMSRNGWMARFYTWTFGAPPRFTGYCPLFWTIWICVILSPFVLIGKIFEFLIKLAITFFEPTEADLKAKRQQQEEEEKAERRRKPLDEEIVELYEFTQKYPDYELYSAAIHTDVRNCAIQWAYETPNWKDFYPQAKANVDRGEAQEKAWEERRRVRKAQMDKIVHYLSFAVKPLLVLSAVFAGFFIYKFVAIVVGMITFGQVVFWATCIGIAAVTVGALILGSLGIYKVGCIVSDKLDSRPEKPVKPKRTYFLFDRVLRGIVEGISFVFETIRMTYKKECPLIIWTNDETGPIEKRRTKTAASERSETSAQTGLN